MDRQLIPLKQFTRASNEGLTLVEVLTSVIVAAVVLPLALQTLVFNRQLYLEDQARITVNQNLRTAMDLIGTDTKQAGERISDAVFPAIQVTGGTQLAVRRRLVNPIAANPDLPILPVCQAIATGTNDPIFSASGAPTPPAGCVPVPDSNADGWPDNIEAWRNFRCSRDGVAGCQGGAGEQVRAHIYDGVGNIQPFTYTGEDSGTYEIQKTAVAWARNYSTSTSLYLLEERQFSLAANVLQLSIDGNATPLRLVNQLSGFQVRAVMQDDTELSVFPVVGNTSWRQIKSIKVNLTAQPPTTQGTVTVKNLQAESRFFPRNALSR